MATPIAYGSLRSHPSQNTPTVGRGILFSNQWVGQFWVATVGHFSVAISTMPAILNVLAGEIQAAAFFEAGSEIVKYGIY